LNSTAEVIAFTAAFIAAPRVLWVC
jgi:hypothetical protein